MSGTFNCPTCGAPLDYPGSGETLRCPYCSNSVIVPPEIRPQANAIPLVPEVFKEVARLARSDQKIEAVKLYRQITNKGLKEAVDAVEAIGAGGTIPQPQKPSQGSKVKAFLVACAILLFFLGIASIFPLVYIPIGIDAWQSNEIGGAIGAFFAAGIWAIVWGGFGCFIFYFLVSF
jgi:DNA-directed RNA polymerase subunit RPC12/RpoP